MAFLIGEKPIPSAEMVKFNFGNLFGNVLHLARQQIAHDTPPNPDVISDFLSDLSNHFRRVPAEGGGNDTSREENNREASANSIRQAGEGTVNTIGNDAGVTTPRDISSTDLALSVVNDHNHEVSQHWTEGLAAAHSDTTTEAHNSPDIIDPALLPVYLYCHKWQVCNFQFQQVSSIIVHLRKYQILRKKTNPPLLQSLQKRVHSIIVHPQIN